MLLKIDKNSIYRKENRVELKNTHVYCSSMEFMGGKIIIVYNPFLESLRREYYYDHSEDEDIASLLGYSLIYHNTELPDGEVVKNITIRNTGISGTEALSILSTGYNVYLKDTESNTE